MANLHLLGTGAALSDLPLTTTMLAVTDGSSSLIIDCGGDLMQRLLAAGIAQESIDALFLTHEHPDHIGGFPLLMRKLSLSRRREPLPICGPQPTLDQVRRTFGTYDTSRWKHTFELSWRPVPLARRQLAYRDANWEVRTSPTRHSAPGIGLRITHVPSAGVVAYSSDTSRSPLIAELATGADILVHEATGPYAGHATAAEGAIVAREAGAGKLLLVHFIQQPTAQEMQDVRKIFEHAEIGKELGAYDF